MQGRSPYASRQRAELTGSGEAGSQNFWGSERSMTLGDKMRTRRTQRDLAESRSGDGGQSVQAIRRVLTNPNQMQGRSPYTSQQRAELTGSGEAGSQNFWGSERSMTLGDKTQTRRTQSDLAESRSGMTDRASKRPAASSPTPTRCKGAAPIRAGSLGRPDLDLRESPRPPQEPARPALSCLKAWEGRATFHPPNTNKTPAKLFESFWEGRATFHPPNTNKTRARHFIRQTQTKHLLHVQTYETLFRRTKREFNN
jgi:hypothetical protein